MIDAPQQDWPAYERRSRQADAAWYRSLTPSQRFALYEDLYRIVMAGRQGPGDWSRLETWQWREKVARRLKEVEAYRKLDELRREQSDSTRAS
jgi:hypothetical protein